MLANYDKSFGGVIDWLGVAYGIFNQELSCPFFG